ncbi:hypothetical protein PGB90_004636 [Kerria lacca]
MPRFCLETNIPSKQIPENFMSLCVQNLSKLTGKPETFCVCFIQTDQNMFFGDDDKPCAIANISSIGGLGIEDNKRYCNVFFKLIEEYLGISQKKIWLTFTENLPEFVTFKGKSFYHITMCRDPGTPIIHSPDE